MLDLLLQDRELIQNFQTSEREPFAMIFCSKFIIITALFSLTKLLLMCFFEKEVEWRLRCKFLRDVSIRTLQGFLKPGVILSSFQGGRFCNLTWSLNFLCRSISPRRPRVVFVAHSVLSTKSESSLAFLCRTWLVTSSTGVGPPLQVSDLLPSWWYWWYLCQRPVAGCWLTARKSEPTNRCGGFGDQMSKLRRKWMK